MKKNKLLILAIVAFLTVFTSYKTAPDLGASTGWYRAGDYAGQGVKIDGLWWAPVNVGCTEDNPFGLLFNWGHNAGFAYEDEDNATTLDDGSWAEQDQGPCPDGWRVPTEDEYANLLTAENSPIGSTDSFPGQWRENDEDYFYSQPGRWFGPNCKTATKDNPGSAVFFPAAGYWFWGGTSFPRFNDIGIIGTYWGTSSLGISLNFSNEYVEILEGSLRDGYSVRCVQK